MAAYAGLASLSQTIQLNLNKAKSLFPLKAEDKIRSIHEYVIFLLSFLEEDYPEKSNRWEGKMRDLAHETEDIIEQFMWQRSYNRWIETSSLKFEEQLRNVAEKFCLIAGDVMDERPANSSPVTVSSSSSSSSRGSALTGNNGAVISLEGDELAIKLRLCGISSKLQFVPISGMGGIGKTTLARTIYDDQLISEHFHVRVWLTISQDYRAHKVLLGVLNSIKLIEEEHMCLDALESMKLIEENAGKEKVDDVSVMAEKVYKKLKGRRYLVVLDDVWNTEVLDDLRYIFPDDGNGSRIMLTTRLSSLAAYPDSNSNIPPHEMRFMNDSQSWDLLKGKVFANNNCPLELEDVGKEIARSCGGLPLAIVLVAGLLSKVNRTQSYWKEIAENVNAIVGQEVDGILSLSYKQLPHHLRPCFLFLGVYPEDEDIRASTLIRLWLAEGFLKHENGYNKSLEEKAEEYLEDLSKRNLVIVTSRKSDGSMKSCSLHDMVRDLCIRKAQDEKFLCIMGGHTVVSPGMTSDVKIQHGIHYGNDIHVPQSMTRDENIDYRRDYGTVEVDRVIREARDEKFLRVAPQGMMNERRISFRLPDIDHFWCPTIRTILCFQLLRFPSSPAFWGRFRLLRVLDAMCQNNKLPSQVFELFHLRYLALSCPSHIPSGIANFVNLETLIILPSTSKWKRYSYWRAVENQFHFSLPRLRHLILYDLCRLPHPPNESSNPPLENLQTLTYVKDLVWTEKILQMIPNLRKLGLAYDTNNELQLHHLKHLHHLEKLEVYGFKIFSWMVHIPNFPRTLKNLTLVRVRFPWKDMSIIGSLPNLQVLKLRIHACKGETWETAVGEFAELRFLLIERSGLRHWITECSHFPRLKCLVLRSCRVLKEIPEGVGEITTLELIEVDSCTESVVESAKLINEEQHSYGNYALRVHVSRNE